MKPAFILALALSLLVGCATAPRPHVVEYRVIKGLSPLAEELLNKAATEGYSFVSWSFASPAIYVTLERDHSVRAPLFEYRVFWTYATNLQAKLNEHARQNFRLVSFTTGTDEHSVVIVRRLRQ